MNFSTQWWPVILVIAAQSAFAGPLVDLASLRLEGRCQKLGNPTEELGTFNLDPFDSKRATFKAVELVAFREEVVTDVIVQFAMFDELNIQLASIFGTTSLGRASLSSPSVGNRISATLPLTVSGKVVCEGVVTRVE